MANINKLEMAQAVINHNNIKVEKTFFGLKTRVVYTPTDSVVNCEEIEFAASVGERMLKLLKTPEEKLAKAVADAGKFDKSQIGPLRLEACVSADKQFVAMQMFRLVNFNNVPECDVVIYEGPTAELLASVL